MNPEQLTIHDHTRVVRAVMEHIVDVLRRLGEKPADRDFTPREIFEAALQVKQIDSYTRDRVRLMLDMLPWFEDAQRNIPEHLKKAIDDVRAKIADCPLPEMIKIFREEGDRAKYTELKQGFKLAVEILEDGSSSIYSPDFSFYQLLMNRQSELPGVRPRSYTYPEMLGMVAGADAIGASIGGAVGAAATLPAGGIGAPGMAALCGGAASAGAAIGIGIALATMESP